jgi:hypothetical protein
VCLGMRSVCFTLHSRCDGLRVTEIRGRKSLVGEAGRPFPDWSAALVWETYMLSFLSSLLFRLPITQSPDTGSDPDMG